MRRGLLCKGCGAKCTGEEIEAEIACPGCEEKGCDQCEGRGYFTLSECPREAVGYELTEAINVAGMCEGGVLPVEGGLVSQSAWFLDLHSRMKSEQNRIDAERWDRGS